MTKSKRCQLNSNKRWRELSHCVFFIASVQIDFDHQTVHTVEGKLRETAYVAVPRQAKTSTLAVPFCNHAIGYWFSIIRLSRVKFLQGHNNFASVVHTPFKFIYKKKPQKRCMRIPPLSEKYQPRRQ